MFIRKNFFVWRAITVFFKCGNCAALHRENLERDWLTIQLILDEAKAFLVRTEPRDVAYSSALRLALIALMDLILVIVWEGLRRATVFPGAGVL